MMKDNDGLITCPYIGDLHFCPSQACLKNYKLKSKMTKRTDREEFEKMLDTLSVEIWSGSDLNKLWSWVENYKNKALQSYSLEMDEVIGEDFNGKEYPYGEDGWQDDGEDTTTYAQDCINEVKASQRQEKLEIDKKWGIK